MASPLRVAGPDGMTMIRELPANPLRTRDARSDGAGLARRATNDVGIIGLDRPATGVVGIINGGRGHASPAVVHANTVTLPSNPAGKVKSPFSPTFGEFTQPPLIKFRTLTVTP